MAFLFLARLAHLGVIFEIPVPNSSALPLKRLAANCVIIRLYELARNCYLISDSDNPEFFRQDSHGHNKRKKFQ